MATCKQHYDCPDVISMCMNRQTEKCGQYIEQHVKVSVGAADKSDSI